jgi:hypothetical protein
VCVLTSASMIVYLFFTRSWTAIIRPKLFFARSWSAIIGTKLQILCHAHSICITILENRIICCQIFYDLLLKSAFERIVNVMQCYDRQSLEQSHRKLISLHNNGKDDKHAHETDTATSGLRWIFHMHSEFEIFLFTTATFKYTYRAPSDELDKNISERSLFYF